MRVAERLGVGGDPTNKKNLLPKTSDGEPYDYQELYELATHHLENGVRAYQIALAQENMILSSRTDSLIISTSLLFKD